MLNTTKTNIVVKLVYLPHRYIYLIESDKRLSFNEMHRDILYAEEPIFFFLLPLFFSCTVPKVEQYLREEKIKNLVVICALSNIIYM